MNPETREKLIKYHLVGNRRGASRWLLIYTIIAAPITMAFAIDGHWDQVPLGLLSICIPLAAILLENRVYPKGQSATVQSVDENR